MTEPKKRRRITFNEMGGDEFDAAQLAAALMPRALSEIQPRVAAPVLVVGGVFHAAGSREPVGWGTGWLIADLVGAATRLLWSNRRRRAAAERFTTATGLPPELILAITEDQVIFFEGHPRRPTKGLFVGQVPFDAGAQQGEWPRSTLEVTARRTRRVTQLTLRAPGQHSLELEADRDAFLADPVVSELTRNQPT